MRVLTMCAAAAFLASATAAPAVVVSWADLTTANDATGTVTGTVNAKGTDVGLTYTGGYSRAQVNGGANYWVEPVASNRPYSGIVDNGPATSDIIQITTGGLKTITFSQTVSDVYLALVSWNGNSGTFNQPFEVISSGHGYWGNGSFTDVTPTSFRGVGELHGVIRFTGEFDSVSFVDNTEGWHGILIGIGDVAPPPPSVPEPSTWGLMLLGFGMVGAAARRRSARMAALA